MLSVQIPCRFFAQAIDSSWLCILCMEYYMKLCDLFLVIYDIVVILSKVAAATESKDLHFGPPNYTMHF